MSKGCFPKVSRLMKIAPGEAASRAEKPLLGGVGIGDWGYLRNGGSRGKRLRIKGPCWSSLTVQADICTMYI